MMPSLKLSLGARDFEISPLTIGQLERIQGALFDLKEDPKRRSSVDREVVAIALAKSNPEMTTEALLDVPVATIGALAEAAAAVLKFGGFIQDQPSGEAAGAGTG